jgi:hypothetical protein
MVIVELKGGLGNQMFQYAIAVALSTKNAPVYLDTGFLKTHAADKEHFTARNFELGIFRHLNARYVKNWQITLFQGHGFVARSARFFMDGHLKRIRQQGNEYITFDHCTSPHILFLDGYFQSEQYWGGKKKKIAEAFQFPELDQANGEIMKKIKHQANAVSLHIRRGDYVSSTVNSAVHGVLPLSYYYDALDLLRSKCVSLSLFVFSDDAQWVRENLELNGLTAYYVEDNQGENSWKDMALMSYCRHNIIANSTFSWWGAWLNANPDKIVIAPRSWFADPVMNMQASLVVPEKWIRL